MNRNTLVAFFFGSITATFASGAFTALTAKTPRGSELQLVNVNVAFHQKALTDGGVEPLTTFRACGYEESREMDGGARRLSEPCWTGTVGEAAVKALAVEVLKQGAPLLTP